MSEISEHILHMRMAQKEINRLTAELAHKQEQLDSTAHEVLNLEQELAECKRIAAEKTVERARLADELAEAHKYRTELSTELTAYMVACENIKGQLSGERIRAEQAERELATERMSNEKTYEHNNRLINQIDRYREALERIADCYYKNSTEFQQWALQALKEDGIV